ncbi:uncharacterized protein B0P05DRAFT_556402 [Gilbertella persicaria]|uniref:uncharacterized protein n=1 Tax=Gilbertella persicaria TaxID=101096 RepID=UPI00221FCA94|nr:uncharacterized protein B0P05DRAFT_556402 [Gilbertella persicaria]KAI8062289.1 hypothetical protein B0P05DRAFT_556402 [Gilbertella persicaria]
MNFFEGTSIKILYSLETFSYTSISSKEKEVEMLKQAMNKLDLGQVPHPNMVWTSIRNKPSRVVQFISLMKSALSHKIY